MPNLLQSNVAFTFAIDPNIPVTDPVLSQIISVSCNASVAFPGGSAGGGNVRLSPGGMLATYNQLPQLLAPAPAGRFAMSMNNPPAEIVGPQPLNASQATLNYENLTCSLQLSFQSMMGGSNATASLAIPFSSQNVAILLTDWAFNAMPGFIEGPQINTATVQVTADGVAQTVTANWVNPLTT